jgi:8-oxo-dGTP diphosphatase
MPSKTEPEIRAAGGVLWRTGADGVEIAVVHRPRYDDWSLPKGKLDPGEGWKAAALREVEEETGVRCSLGEELPSVSYDDNKGRRKCVRYWLMQAADESADAPFEPNDETDDLRWLAPGDAAQLLTYERDRGVVAAAAQVLG